MTNNMKLNLGPMQANKFIAGLPAERENIAAPSQFRHDLLESQQRDNYQHGFDRLHGAKRLPALHPNVNERMKEIQHKA